MKGKELLNKRWILSSTLDSYTDATLDRARQLREDIVAIDACIKVIQEHSHGIGTPE